MQEKSQVNNLTYQLKKLEKELHIMSKIEESGSDIDKRENLKIRHQKTNRTSQWKQELFFWKDAQNW